MQRQTVAIVLLIGLAFGLVSLTPAMSSWRLFDNQQGYAPPQPIAFSHRLHAGELQLDCRFCHTAAGESRHAGIPSSDTCMKCHKFVTAPYGLVQDEVSKAGEENREPNVVVSEEIAKLYEALGLGEDLQPDPEKTPQPVAWVRVHDLPDFVYFDHRAHVHAGVSCQKCHGPVESMQQMRQFSDLTMGWCVNCHRESNAKGIEGHAMDASLDCASCHY
ncbi:MAG: hypothetical protein DWQ31_20180 [Planctomycetota bacterium]|nr:MAG: hypothetical protein DWQ31_20180 [Planctomycetota bacterium]REJ96453.1 MAG: hypothetical protein DWQ35_04465 [Planctomycetota bacterium]REK25097.1 MAG: hypothetical protein DWQ42_12055 [Planctomycetota bacterium]REK44665.1 MAG: hypothetical protein DWQ46_08820 [Planctomycetota bacterium]